MGPRPQFSSWCQRLIPDNIATMPMNRGSREHTLPQPRAVQDVRLSRRMQVPIASLLSFNLRTILPGAMWAVLILTANLCHAQSNLALNAAGTTLEGNPTNGVILRIHDTASGITLAPAPSVAENFRLTLQKPDRTTVTLLGKD